MRNPIPETHTDEEYLQDYLLPLTCKETGVSSKEAFMKGSTEKFVNYFC